MMAGEAQWVRGLVHFAEDDQVVNNDWVGSAVNFGEDSWDDSAILDIFDSAIRSHKTKKEMKVVSTSSSVLPASGIAREKMDSTTKMENGRMTSSKAAVLGPWTPVTTTESNTESKSKSNIAPSNHQDTSTYSNKNDESAIFHRDEYDKTDADNVPQNIKIGSTFQRYLSSNTHDGKTQNQKNTSKYPETNNYSESYQSVPGTSNPQSSSSSYPSSYSAERYAETVNNKEYSNQSTWHNQGNGDYNNEANNITENTELEESFNAMMMAWYQSGYATGRYQTLLELSKRENRQHSSPPPLPLPPRPDPKGYPMREDRGNRQTEDRGNR